MRSMLAVGALVVAFVQASAVFVTAQAPKGLQEAMDARSKGMASGDAETWGKYTTEDFVVVELTGVMKTRAQRMVELKAPPAATPAPADQKVRMYGSAAVATSRVTSQGKPAMVTVFWVEQQGQWKAAAAQVTAIADAK